MASYTLSSESGESKAPNTTSPSLKNNNHEEATYWYSKHPGDHYKRLHLCPQHSVCPRPYPSKHYFRSRPRRFGKSLFLSTLEEIFKGDKALFEECHIAQSNHDWQPYPVLLFDFGSITNTTPEELKAH